MKMSSANKVLIHKGPIRPWNEHLEYARVHNGFLVTYLSKYTHNYCTGTYYTLYSTHFMRVSIISFISLMD